MDRDIINWQQGMSAIRNDIEVHDLHVLNKMMTDIVLYFDVDWRYS